MDKVIGKNFILKDGTKVPFEQILGAKVVLCYYSGQWCPPCILMYFDI